MVSAQKMVPSTMNISEVSDETLFELMKNVDSDHSKLAWGEFYKRYKKYLWKCCLSQCRSLPEGDSFAKDLFQATMQKIYLNASKFKKEKNSGIKAWMSRIAQNEFHDYLKKYHLNFSNEIPEEVPDEEGEDEDDQIASEHIQGIKFDKLKSILSKLTEKEYKILITTMSYYQIDKPNAHTPDSVIEELCKEFDIAPATVRQIKRRAIMKLKDLAKDLTD